VPGRTPHRVGEFPDKLSFSRHGFATFSESDCSHSRPELPGDRYDKQDGLALRCRWVSTRIEVDYIIHSGLVTTSIVYWRLLNLGKFLEFG
jgi:hypothetical protein